MANSAKRFLMALQGEDAWREYASYDAASGLDFKRQHDLFGQSEVPISTRLAPMEIPTTRFGMIWGATFPVHPPACSLPKIPSPKTVSISPAHLIFMTDG